MAVSATDEQYLIGEGEHVNQLRACDVRQLGLLIGDSSVGLSDWQTLAGRLGISNDDVRRIAAMMREAGDSRVVPGEEVLKLWGRKPKSTIRVLRHVLDKMERDDVVRQLYYMRFNMVDFTIVLIRDGHENVVLPAKCPGRKPLVEYVRPLLISILDLRSVDHGQRIVIQLNVGAGVEADWSWPAERVAGQECSLTQEVVRASPSDRSSMPTRRILRRRVTRNVISWLMDSETLMFGYKPTEQTHSPSAAAPRPEVADTSELEDDDDTPRFENDIEDRREVREARLLAGFHDIDLRRKEQEVNNLLSPYLREQGRYILRTSSSQPSVVLAISVTHNWQIRHYYIFSKYEHSCMRYTIRIKEGYQWDSLRALLDHYHRHSIERCPDGDEVLLTSPVVTNRRLQCCSPAVTTTSL